VVKVSVEVDVPAPPSPPSNTVNIPSLTVTVKNEDETLVLGTDESYSLVVPADGTGATLTAQTPYGALRGLETFHQLVQYTESGFIIPYLPIRINDAPRFPWRGFLVDTARHFHPLWSLKHVIDALSMAKLNVLHWHLVDAEVRVLCRHNRKIVAHFTECRSFV
jgi:hexosaminidase